MIYHGSCHCGDLKLEYDTPVPPGEWPLRACQCSFCRKHGVVSTSVKEAVLRMVAAPSAINEYLFGLQVTRFMLCARCGVYVAAVSEYEGIEYAVLIANVLDCRADLTQAVNPVVYDDEDPELRLSRRSERWARWEFEPLS